MIIIGARGFAKQLVEVFFQLASIEDLFFFDDVNELSQNTLFGIKIITSIEAAQTIFLKISDEFCLGVGDPAVRKMLCDKFEGVGGRLTTVTSPKAIISSHVKGIGIGSTILQGAVIENDVKIGKGALINVNAVVHHDVQAGDYCQISPGAKILGNVNMGNSCSIGANAVILPNLRIGDNCIIGAGAVVINDVLENSVVVGVPAKPLKI